MTDDVLTTQERHVLDLAGDDFGAFTLLAWLGSDEHQPERAAATVERLFERGLVEIAEDSDNHGPPRVLSSEEALHAVRDKRKWRDPQQEPFEQGEHYYLVRATPAGYSVLERLGWQPS